MIADRGNASQNSAEEQSSFVPAMSLAQAHEHLTKTGSPYEVETLVLDGLTCRTWKHAPSTNREVLLAARAHGDRPFLIWNAERISFEAFYRAVARLAVELQTLGVRKGDRVAIAMRNLPEWPVAFYAASVIGAVVTPLNAWWLSNEMAYGLRHSGAVAVFVDPERLERLRTVRDQLPDLRHVLTCRFEGGDGSDTRSIEGLIGATSRWAELPDTPLPDLALAPEDLATIFYTSGTTSEPKGVPATHRAMLSNITGAAFAGARAAIRAGRDPFPPAPADQAATLMVIPFFHVTGTFAILSPALMGGHKLVMMRRWDPEAAMEMIQHERISWVVGVPTIAWQLAEHPRVSDYDLSSLASLGYGGAAAAPELLNRLATTLPAAVPGHGWGMTETSGLATTHSAEDYLSRPKSCGAPVAVVDIRIMSEDGLERTTGDVGEIWVTGPNVVRGYWQDVQASEETFVDGWMRTGDLGYVDAEGFLYIVDRAKDMLIRGGENIFCIEVENSLYEHPDVMDAAVLGMPDRILGEIPVAVVALRPGASVGEDALRRHVGQRLAAYKTPVSILIRTEPLERNANGKIVKAGLRPLFAPAGDTDHG